MSDSPKPLKPRMTMLSVSPDDFVRFITAKGTKTDECPICGHTEWSVLCSPDDEPVFRVGMPVRNREEEFYLSAFGYYCESCGYLRQHMAAVVHKWVQENPAPGNAVIDKVEPGGIDSDA